MSSQDRFRKNQSMNSTHHMSCNHSNTTNFYIGNKPKTATVVNYSRIPIPKECPRWTQSASTWRHTSHKYGFSKDSRFKDNSSYCSDIIEPHLPSSINSNKSCTFGKGNKRPISVVVLRNAKQKPGPDRYDMSITDQQPRLSARGKTFGIGWKYYQRKYMNHRNDVYAQFQNEDNPPAKYQVRQIPGNDTNKFTAYGRLKMYSQKMAQNKNWVPGPYHKVDDRRLYGTVGLNDRNFSFGQRIDLAKPLNLNPEAIYNITGFCQRFTKLRRKQERNVSSRT